MPENEQPIDFKAHARQIYGKERAAIEAMPQELDWERLQAAFGLILGCQGMIWVTGAGTSGSIARRLAHTLTCSGAPAAYLDPGQSAHGYSAIVRGVDVLIGFSRGGETDEVNHLLAVAREREARIISILEDPASPMADLSEVVISCPVRAEHDAQGFIPFSSTLVQALVGDLLCAGVLHERGYSAGEFGQLHPGGAVGKRLESSKEATGAAHVGRLADLRGLIIDMDGVLWHGEDPLPGLAEFFETLQARGIKFVLATNNPSRRPEEFAEKARRFGIPVEAGDVVTCVQAVIHYLKQKYSPGTRVHAIGEAALKEQLEDAGYVLADEDVQAVIVALDRQLNHDTFKRATLLIRAGAEFIGTNADPSYPTEEGFVPGSGMMVIALAATSDTQPVVMGKPGRVLFDLALERMQLPLERVASVGDRLDTDIAGGQQLGMQTILLLSGIASRDDLAGSPVHPDWVFENLAALGKALSD